MDDKDNANPNILNPSDLPSRRSDNVFKPRADGGTGLFDDLVPQNEYLSDSPSRSDSSSDDEEEEREEIDAQEIYGTPPVPSTSRDACFMAFFNSSAILILEPC